MTKRKVLIVGATGETGGGILEGLIQAGAFHITCLIRPSSVSKPSTQALKDRGLKITVGDLSGNLQSLINVLQGYDIVINAMSPGFIDQDIRLVDAAAAAGVKRFVPCTFATVCPPGGVMFLRDQKEKVINRIWSHHLPYTIIECGFWYQIVFFAVPSGKLDYAVTLNSNVIYGSGNVKTNITDWRDVGPVVARILQDNRTLNRFVFMAGEVMSQSEILSLEERLSGETPMIERISKEALEARMKPAKAELAKDPQPEFTKYLPLVVDQYLYSMHVRGDNTPEVARYLGYLDARELYPDYKFIKFEDYFKELMEGKAKKPYEGRYVPIEAAQDLKKS